MYKENLIRKEVGCRKKISPLRRSFELNKMLEKLRGKRFDSQDENIRRVVGRINQK